jgi:prepilin-type N-terminal cleavage/methylation domain-containing protein
MKLARPLRKTIRRAFTLLECVAVITVLAIAIPCTLSWVDESASNRADAINATRATMLGSAVMEHVLADVASTTAGQGATGLNSSSTYLDTAVTGLVALMSSTSSFYATIGMTYTVTIGGLTDFDGVSRGVAVDVFRLVTVTVSYPSARGGTLSIPISSRVAAL